MSLSVWPTSRPSLRLAGKVNASVSQPMARSVSPRFIARTAKRRQLAMNSPVTRPSPPSQGWNTTVGQDRACFIELALKIEKPDKFDRQVVALKDEIPALPE